MTLHCPACTTGVRGPGKYLCLGCWSGLSMSARRALSRRDRFALTRLRDLHAALAAGTPLDRITVTP